MKKTHCRWTYALHSQHVYFKELFRRSKILLSNLEKVTTFSYGVPRISASMSGRVSARRDYPSHIPRRKIPMPLILSFPRRGFKEEGGQGALARSGPRKLETSATAPHAVVTARPVPKSPPPATCQDNFPAECNLNTVVKQGERKDVGRREREQHGGRYLPQCVRTQNVRCQPHHSRGLPFCYS